jgi:hypothetical protein
MMVMRSQERKHGRRVPLHPHAPKMRKDWNRLPPNPPLRTYRIKPDPSRCEVVEVMVTRTPKAMQRVYERREGRKRKADAHLVMGRCDSWHRNYGPSHVSRLHSGLVVARMYFNARDLRKKPSEISSHEAGHAAMAYARWLRVNLDWMAGEEIMVHALGRLVCQTNVVLYAAGVWRGKM